MPTEEGLVKETGNGKARVRVQRSSACKSCSSRDHCEINSSRDVTVDVINEIGAKEGDWVELSVPAGSFSEAFPGGLSPSGCGADRGGGGW